MEEKKKETLPEALVREIARVRDEVRPAYVSIGSPGRFALEILDRSLTRADKALEEHDAAEMVIAYKSLRDFDV